MLRQEGVLLLLVTFLVSATLNLLTMKINGITSNQEVSNKDGAREEQKTHKIRFATSWRTVLPQKFLSSKIVY
jgi:hypothetical protein